MTMDPAIALMLRGALGLLFFWAVAHKLRDMTAFRGVLAGYALLPAAVVRSAATIFIGTEVAVGAILWIGIAGIAGLAAAALLSVYTAAISVNLARGRRDIHCGCGGAAAQALSAALVARNALLIGAALLAALPVAPRGLLVIDAITIGAGIVALALLYAAIDELIANAPRVAALVGERARRAALENPEHA